MRPTRIAPLHLAALVWALVAFLVVRHADQLAWASLGLPLYVVGEFPMLRERELAAQAVDALKAGDAERALVLIERARAIDPLSFHEAHAQIHLGMRDYDAALAMYAELLEIDPGVPAAYLNMARIYERRDADAERRAVLERGIAYFERSSRELQPRFDDEVASEYNRKARATYDAHRQAALRLRDRLEGRER